MYLLDENMLELGVLDILLIDRTTGENIFWATDNYQDYGVGYCFGDAIKPELITGKHGNVIMPRIKKEKDIQKSRSKDMAEVFTPSWVCNAQNNLIDNAWFNKEGVFNIEQDTSWQSNQSKVKFPLGKTYIDYVKDTRLEITCGEAPYLTSRYDTTTGIFIPIKDRIGLLDRKLRVINENVEDSKRWLTMTKKAYQHIYGYEWQGDNLLLSRESLLLTFIENYIYKFNTKPTLTSIKSIATIISWNIWQMDGLKCVIPASCDTKTNETITIFGDTETITEECLGCKFGIIQKHNGIYACIKDWEYKDPQTGKKGNVIRFVDLINS
jgi:hypothetical protein